jgi:predicted helicase
MKTKNEKTQKINYIDIITKLNKFSDIYENISHLDAKQKGDVFEILTKYIFLVHHEYCKKTKNIWLYDDIPTKFVKNFNLPPKDKGIDLLLETIDNNYYAIQSKFRSDQNDNIAWADLSTFAGQLYVGNFFMCEIIQFHT